MTIEHPRLLLIDSYDSFTHNLASLCRQAIPDCALTVIKNDEYNVSALRAYLPYFSAVIVGPGPGSPDNPEDIGVVKDLWKLKNEDVIPIFGVCLGLQSLAIEHGAVLKRLNTVKHGQLSHIHHHGTDLFRDVGPIHAVRYHSLHVELKNDGDVEELAWTEDDENGKVVMAVHHKSSPFWAVQYHPESVCTEGGGLQVVSNFWRLAESWSVRAGRRAVPWSAALSETFGTPWPQATFSSPFPTSRKHPGVATLVLDRSDLTVVDICEAFGASQEASQFVLLESAAKPGRFSIVGCLSSSTLHVKYRVGDTTVSLTKDGRTFHEALHTQDIWTWLAIFMRSRAIANGNPELPFWGGFIGSLSYELGVQGLHVQLDRAEKGFSDNKHPDVNLVFVERSVVVDSQTGKIYLQSIAPNDDKWLSDTITELQALPIEASNDSPLPLGKPSITLPSKTRYISRINQAKEHLFAGDSYELCLTAQTRISIASTGLPSASSISWERYKRLRRRNPAPHSAYLRLHPTTLLSSSPERFLSYTRPPGTVCQLRPIKGTICKAPHITRAVAEQALVGSTKEVAENLMIVDLIRHDLHGVVGDDVKVRRFCSVEEYETVWQLVSVIEGKLKDDESFPEDQLGWQVLKRSLPPGSMTGAPKKRSVEILQTLEDQERGIYSGVFGYWCVSGGGDWSVTIRSCFKYAEEQSVEQQRDCTVGFHEEWAIGAGGAITALSDSEAEWEEMITKLQSVLRAFGA
ncbi:hypothetical protein NLJ89_g1353 [Agrocybe chaxingu]|uniref:aminodeoxychorismate synthase n=1 Tax=Agrocybe chaxingu TaxID=84603 RepID=A0A9W8N099_9AGAR|nr:hypothetical protein NLJ89_g1353 [Agrocybe chaxingu]